MGRMGFPIWLVHNADAAVGDRRGAPRPAPLVTREGLRVEALAFEVMRLHRDAWIDLAARALESNIFFDPDFALAAAQHSPPARRPRFAVVRGLVEGRMALLAVCPISPGRAGLAGSVSVWSHDYAALGAPLLDAATAAAAFEAVAEWAARESPGAGALLVPSLPQDGPTLAMLRRRAVQGAHRLRLFDARARAVFRNRGARAHENKEHRRQWRRLSEEGRLAFRVETEPTRVRDGLEQFLALEAAGWKGAAGTALLQDGGAATFARSAVRQLARRGRARVAQLTLDGAPIALGVILVDGPRAAYWKIAHDPAQARFSPGVLLTLRLGEHLAADPTIDVVDSCAIEGHPMIDRLWPERLGVVDVAVSLPSAQRAFPASAARERLRRSVRSLAKRAFYKATRRKVS